MSTPLLRWGIIGTGHIARRFARDLRHSSTGRLVAVGSRDASRAWGFTAEFGAGIAADETAKILARDDVDAIYVGTINRAHAPIALAALEAGKPVLVEKPLAPTLAEAEAIRETAAARGLLAMEAMWMVFTPGIARLKSLLAEGAVGEPRMLSANLSYARTYHPDLDLFDAETGGALLDLGVYPIALALHLFGPADETAAITERNDAGSLRQAALVTRHGKVLTKLSCGFETEGPNGATVSGEHGRIALAGPFFCPPLLMLHRHVAGTALDYRHDVLSPHGNANGDDDASGATSGPAAPSPKVETFETPHVGSGLQYQADHFAECLRAGLTQSHVHPLSASIAALEVITRAARR